MHRPLVALERIAACHPAIRHLNYNRRRSIAGRRDEAVAENLVRERVGRKGRVVEKQIADHREAVLCSVADFLDTWSMVMMGETPRSAPHIVQT